METRVAMLEDGNLVELFIERGDISDIAGNIYKGRVQRVLPGMQAAFVDIGLGQAAFLYAGDVIRENHKDVAPQCVHDLRVYQFAPTKDGHAIADLFDL